MVTIKKVELTDAGTLLALSKKTFLNFFAHLNDSANMDAYSVIAFTHQQMQAELTNPDSDFYFAMLNNEIAGYLKINFGVAQAEFREENAMEIARIYVLGEHHGKHIGTELLNFAVQAAIKKQLEYLWLGVWEQNINAIGFYEHNGFEVFSSHNFFLGDGKQKDLLMKRMLK